MVIYIMRKFLLVTLSSLILATVPFLAANAQNIEDNPAALEEFGRCIQEHGAVMYGSPNCAHCNKQKEMFKGTFEKYVQFVNCKDGRMMKKCKEAEVGAFPKWTFANGNSVTRPHDLWSVANTAGCRERVIAAMGGEPSNTSSSQEIFATATPFSGNTSNISPEGLAKCLKEKDVKFYGSSICSHCNLEKELFAGAFEKYLYENFKDCGGKDQKECKRLNTYPFPTWYEASTGKKLTRAESLEKIANTFGCNGSEIASNSSTASNSIILNKPSKPVAEDSLDYVAPKQTQKQEQTQANKPQEQQVQKQEQAQVNKPENIKDDQTVFNSSPFLKTEVIEDPALNNPQSSPYAPETSANNNDSSSSTDDRKIQVGKCLSTKNAVLYFMKGNPYSDKQFQEIGVAADLVKKVDCSDGNAKCDGIVVYPTWTMGNNTKYLPGFYDLENLAQVFECN